jgi:phosphatidylinositol alpha-1,6-mannosyltransferase
LPLDFPSWGLFPRGTLSYLKTFRRLLGVVRQHGVRQVHAATLLPEGFLALMLARWLRLAYLVFVHGEELTVASRSRELSIMARAVLRNARAIIANSENTRRLLARDWITRQSDVHVITPGVDTSTFRPAPRCDAIRKKLQWGKRPVILTTGRLELRKGQDTLIRALPTVIKSAPDALYAVVGDGSQCQRLEAMASELNLRRHVRFHGELNDDELIQCYQQCDLAALPNRDVNGDFEGFGMVLVEAQACGRPVLAGNSGGTAETLKDGITGRLVDCTTPDSLALALIDMLSNRDHLEDMGRAARMWATERFDWRNIAASAATVFSAVGNADHHAAPQATISRQKVDPSNPLGAPSQH